MIRIVIPFTNSCVKYFYKKHKIRKGLIIVEQTTITFDCNEINAGTLFCKKSRRQKSLSFLNS